MLFSAISGTSIITMLLIYSLLLYWYWGAASNAFQPATRSVPEAIGASRQCR
jgi:F0F1-type ATP synthase membrane subunit b/b'